MRKLFLIAVTVMALPLFAAQAPAAAYKPCGGGFNPDGSKGSFYRLIKAKGLSCPTAKSVTRAWVKYEAMLDGANPTGAVKVKGYQCSGKAVKSSLVVTCSKGKKAVRFTGHP